LVAETLATNLNAPTALAIAPDGRVFIADQTGPVRVWKDGRLLAAPALNLAGRVDDFWERGLLGLALHPDYPHTPHLFVLYVARLPFTHHVVSRFTMLGDRAHPSSELVLNRGTIWRDGKKWQPDSGLLVRFRPVA
jgi:glucose/arabinose dehydrogenase